ncbi:hypothetical protein QBC42DRAFT_325679 [Cladorrhinum samala]|uniref:Uncharacterized protein n=1 Tax=Cladorrhinum samala TaxID=585594 RepID=A0AAV9HQF5_9PEZI|nr:hypothetical protein QBC42DRAFT_325679 [Cladorrhinum samala]
MSNNYSGSRGDFWKRTNEGFDRRIANLRHERDSLSIQNKTLEIKIETERINLDSERLSAGSVTRCAISNASSGYGSSTLDFAINSTQLPYTNSSSFATTNYGTPTLHNSPTFPPSYRAYSTGYGTNSSIPAYNTTYNSHYTPESFGLSSPKPTYRSSVNYKPSTPQAQPPPVHTNPTATSYHSPPAQAATSSSPPTRNINSWLQATSALPQPNTTTTSSTPPSVISTSSSSCSWRTSSTLKGLNTRRPPPSTASSSSSAAPTPFETYLAERERSRERGKTAAKEAQEALWRSSMMEAGELKGKEKRKTTGGEGAGGGLFDWRGDNKRREL